MQHKRTRLFGIALVSTLLTCPGASNGQTEDIKSFSPKQIQAGSDIYGQNCSPCHGPRMLSPEAFDLRTFPRDQHARFIASVTKGKNSMPPWGGMISAEDIESLWAYVVAGEKR